MDKRTLKFVRPKDSQGNIIAEKYTSTEITLMGNYILVSSLHAAICEYMRITHPDWERKQE